MKYIDKSKIIGLGTGSTVNKFLHIVHENFIKNSIDIKAISTSSQTTNLATSLGIEVLDFNSVEEIEILIDGADEVDPSKNLIKGGGGALLMEKIVANFSKNLIIIADETKMVNTLGKFPLPVEIVRFGYDKTRNNICNLLSDLKYTDFQVILRRDKRNNFLTDESNFILDLHLNQIEDAYLLSRELLMIPGVIEVGLFLDMASKVIVGRDDKRVDIF